MRGALPPAPHVEGEGQEMERSKRWIGARTCRRPRLEVPRWWWLWVVFGVALWITVGFVAFHFIAKYW